MRNMAPIINHPKRLDPLSMIRYVRVSMEHFVSAVAIEKRTCVVMTSFKPRDRLSTSTSQTCLFQPKCSSASKLMAVNAVVGNYRHQYFQFTKKGRGTNQTCENEPIICSKAFRDSQTRVDSKEYSQADHWEKNQIHDNIRWPSRHRIVIIR